MKKTVATFALATLLATPAFAAPETYALDGGHTFPSFSYTHLGFSRQEHRFNKTTGTVVWDREAHTAKVDIVIDAKSVDVGTALFNEHIQGDELLDTAKYPTITFKSRSVKFVDDTPVSIDGDLTIKGITRPVTLNVTGFHAAVHPMLHREAIGANATTTIKRSDFNASKAVPYVSDEVTLSIAVEAIKQ